MRISTKALDAITASREAKRELMYQMEISDTTLYRWINDNPEDGKLTTATALRIIMETTGLTSNEILTEESSTN
jgi:succinate dehydrogenase flavin-adding protein (antitoxin of CptAB toxin-antitoxin module)